MDPASVSIMISMIGWMASAIVSRLLTESVEGWAKIAYLGEEVDGLKKKLQEITILLDNAQRSNLTNWPLLQSVCDLQQAVYDAEDLLEELDYYRLQDMVEQKQDYRKHVSAKKPCKCTILFRDVVSVVTKKGCKCTILYRDVVSVVTKKGSCSSAGSVSVQEPQPLVPKLDKIDISKRLNGVVKKLDQNGEVVSKALALENLGRIAESLSLENLHKIAENFRRNIKNSETSGNKTVKQISRNMLGIELRKEEMVEIVNRLINNDSGVENIWVLPIFGHGGVGKTTLAKFVFDDEKVKKHFDERMWLRVSSNLDVKSLTLEMIGISNGEQEIGINGDVEDLHDTIKNKLESKKVLLVADNLCPEDMSDERWAWLRELFSGTASKGTKILVTTRNLLFAENIQTGGPIIRLDGLKGKELEAFFDACAYWGNDPKKYPVLHGLRLSLMNKLHGYPLEVKQIGAVLRSKLDFEHWNMVLNSGEWKKLKKKDESKDIMSSLEISYRYLPCDYQKCFSYCSLFPKNFKFRGDNLINLWIAQGFIYSKNGYKSKALGIKCLNELVGRGFLEEVKVVKCQQTPTTYYLMHELLHDLAEIISSKEVLTIDGSDVRSINTSIRHLSIITYSAYKCNDSTNHISRNESFEKKVVEIGKKLEITKLRTLILIGDYDSNFAVIFRDQFKNAKYLRVLILSMESSGIDSLLYNFSNSILLRYLKLDQFFNHSSDKEENESNNRKFPKLLFRLYHLETLDISDWYDDFNLPQLTHRLVSLRRFYARREQLAMISEIGRLQFLEELREFTVQSNPGFDIMQLGKLKNLGGSIRIFNLENIISKEDATKANLVGKTELQDLSLHWSSDRMYAQPDGDLSILENLKPPPSIRNLDIHEYTDSKFPHWMVRFHSPSYLRSLNLINCFNLEDLPPLGQLEVLEKLQFKGMHKIKEVTKEFYGDCAKGPFKSLKEMLFSDMRNWEKWAGTEKYTVFPSLKKLEIINCPVLSELPQQPCGTKSMHWFPCLIEFKVECCRNLVLPPLPHTENLAKINVRNGLDQLKNLALLSPESSLSIEWSKQSRNFNREVLVFSKLSKLTELSIKGCPIARLPWKGFKELASLKRLIIEDLEENTPSKEKWSLPESLELLEIASNHVTGQQLSEWLLCLPNLLTLVIKLSGITCLNVEDESTTSTNNSQLGDSYSSIQIFPHKLKSLKEIIIDGCKNLVSLRPQSGLRGFTSLEKLTIKNCSGFLHPLVGSSDIPIFPPSLLKLEIDYLPENLLSKLISNPSRLEHMKLGYSPKLISLSMRPFGALQDLNIETCRALRSLQDVDSLSSLIQLDISKCPMLSADWEAASQRKESVNENFTLPINVLTIDDTSFLSEKMYGYLPTLEKLIFDGVQTEELKEGLSLVKLTSLKEINFLNCPNLQYLPNGLSNLTHLSTLIIRKCPEIKLLPDLHHLHGLYIDQSNNQLEAWCRKHCKVTKLHVS